MEYTVINGKSQTLREQSAVHKHGAFSSENRSVFQIVLTVGARLALPVSCHHDEIGRGKPRSYI